MPERLRLNSFSLDQQWLHVYTETSKYTLFWFVQKSADKNVWIWLEINYFYNPGAIASLYT